jgi:integrase
VTGLRWCEVSGLKWEDLDGHERMLVTPRKAVKGKLKPSTKTNRARELGVPELIIDELTAVRAWLDATTYPGRESGLMFPSPWARRSLHRASRTRSGTRQASGHHPALHLARAPGAR